MQTAAATGTTCRDWGKRMYVAYDVVCRFFSRGLPWRGDDAIFGRVLLGTKP